MGETETAADALLMSFLQIAHLVRCDISQSCDAPDFLLFVWKGERCCGIDPVGAKLDSQFDGI